MIEGPFSFHLMRRRRDPTRTPYLPRELRAAVFNEDERARVEEAYGQGELGEQLWKEIESATSLHTTFAPTEAQTPYVQDVLKRLDKLTTTAMAVRNAIYGAAVEDRLDPNATLSNIYDTFFSLQNAQSDLSVTNLYLLYRDVLGALLALNNYLKSELQAEQIAGGGFPDGFMWDLWIVRLVGLLKAKKLPTGARHDSDKQKHPSPFVLFIRELQKCLPKSCQRHNHSADAISQAIDRARNRVGSHFGRRGD